jgi:hypothetical protein
LGGASQSGAGDALPTVRQAPGQSLPDLATGQG